MSVSINEIVYQYLQFASEQQRGLTNIASEISEINSRVTDIINLYANANRNVGHDVSPTTPVPTTPVPTTSTQDTPVPTTPETVIENIRNILSPVPPQQEEQLEIPTEPIENNIDSRSSINELTRRRTTSFHERDLPGHTGNVVTRIRHRRSSIAILGPRDSHQDQSETSSLNTILERRPSISPPPPPPPTIPPPIEIPTIRSMTRDIRQSPTSRPNLRYNSSSITNFPYTHRVFTFSNPRTRRTVENLHSNLSPVRVRPSISQIRRGTEILVWNDISDNYQTSCPIDLLDFSEGDSILRIRECKHIFREMNLRRHFRNSATCPICRFDIRDYIPENNAPPLISEEIDDIIGNDIVNTIGNIITTTRSNRRNHSSISLT